MIPDDIRKKIELIKISTGRKVNASFLGNYESAFRGQGIEFDEVREYLPGDDVRFIDWNVTAKTSVPHIKRYVEERQLTILFAVDVSASGYFGSGRGKKIELAAELVSVLSFAAVRNNDRAGLMLFSDKVEKWIPPKKGTEHCMLMVSELLSFKPEGKGTSISGALDYLSGIVRRRCIIFLVSDFCDTGWERKAAVLSAKHEVIALSLTDPAELVLPNAGLVRFKDAETGKVYLCDSSSSSVRKEFEMRAESRQKNLEKQCRKSGMDHLSLKCGEDWLPAILNFFYVREKKRGSFK